jgi:hypothetical protein
VSLHLGQHCLRLGQPEGHLHGAVERDGRGQGGAGLLPLTGLRIQRAETVVAVGLERAHAEFLGQGQGLPVVGFGRLAFRSLAPRRNIAEEAQGIRLVTMFLALTGICQYTLGEGVRLLQMAGQQLRLPQGETTERLMDDRSRCSCLFHCLREQRHGVGTTPGQGVCRTQGRRCPGEIKGEVRVPTEAYGPFEPGECHGQVTLAEG